MVSPTMMTNDKLRWEICESLKVSVLFLCSVSGKELQGDVLCHRALGMSIKLHLPSVLWAPLSLIFDLYHLESLGFRSKRPSKWWVFSFPHSVVNLTNGKLKVPVCNNMARFFSEIFAFIPGSLSLCDSWVRSSDFWLDIPRKAFCSWH